MGLLSNANCGDTGGIFGGSNCELLFFILVFLLLFWNNWGTWDKGGC